MHVKLISFLLGISPLPLAFVLMPFAARSLVAQCARGCCDRIVPGQDVAGLLAMAPDVVLRVQRAQTASTGTTPFGTPAARCTCRMDRTAGVRASRALNRALPNYHGMFYTQWHSQAEGMELTSLRLAPCRSIQRCAAPSNKMSSCLAMDVSATTCFVAVEHFSKPGNCEPSQGSAIR